MGVIVPFHKSGDTKNVNNYRGITLLSNFSKIFTIVLNERLTRWADAEGKLSECQAGFRKGFSTLNNIFALYSIIQKYLARRGGRFYCVFIDFAKAFDTVNHSLLFMSLLQKDVRGKMLTILKSIYKDVKSCVRVGQNVTENFKCPMGVRQGCILSPFLFAIFIDELQNMAEKAGRMGIQITQDLKDIFLLLYADDIIMFSDTIIGLQRLLNILSAFADKWKMNINLSKTKIIVFRNGGILQKTEQWFYKGQRVEVVSY